MDQLRNRLRADGVPDDAYLVDVTGDVTPHTVPGLDDLYVLTRVRDGYWQTFYVDRGRARDPVAFTAEDEACRYVVALLGRDVEAAVTRPPEVTVWPRPVRYLILALAAVCLAFGAYSLVTSGTDAASRAGLRVALSVGIAGVVGATATTIGAVLRARKARRSRRVDPRSHNFGPARQEPPAVHRDLD